MRDAPEVAETAYADHRSLLNARGSVGHDRCLTDRVREFIEMLEGRTKKFAVDCVPYCADLERVPGLRNAGFQLSKASGSVAANHRAMRRSRSDREFAAKLQIVCEEADESVLWLEVADGSVSGQLKLTTDKLLAEAKELRAIFSKARSTFRGRM